MGGAVKDLFVAAATVAIGVVTGGGGFAALQALGWKTFLGRTAVMFGFNQVMKALAPKPNLNLAQQAQQADVTGTGSIQSQKLIYGRAITGGALVYQNLAAYDDTYLNLLLAIAPHSVGRMYQLNVNSDVAFEDFSISSSNDGDTICLTVNVNETTPAASLQKDISRIDSDTHKIIIVGTMEGGSVTFKYEWTAPPTTITTLTGGSVGSPSRKLFVYSFSSGAAADWIRAEWTAGTRCHLQLIAYPKLSTKYDGLINYGLWHDDTYYYTDNWSQGFLDGYPLALATEVAPAGDGSIDDPDNEWHIKLQNNGNTYELEDGIQYAPVMTDTSYMWARIKFDADAFGGNRPNISFVVDGKKVRDPRNTGGAAVTYHGMNNPACVLFDYLTDDQFGCGLSDDEIDFDSFIALANICDEEVLITNQWAVGEVTQDGLYVKFTWKTRDDEPPFAGLLDEMTLTDLNGNYADFTDNAYYGTGNNYVTFLPWSGSVYDGGTDPLDNIAIKSYTIAERYSFNGVLDTENSHKDNIDQILTAMGANLVYASGKYYLIGGDYQTNGATIDESDLVGSVTISTSLPANNKFNVVRGVFLSQRSGYTAESYDPVRDEDQIAIDGQELPLEMNFPFTTNKQQAINLARLALNRSKKRIIVKTSLHFKKIQDITVGSSIQFSYARAGWTNKQFEVIDCTLNIGNGDAPSIDVVMQEMDTTVYEF